MTGNDLYIPTVEEWTSGIDIPWWSIGIVAVVVGVVLLTVTLNLMHRVDQRSLGPETRFLARALGVQVWDRSLLNKLAESLDEPVPVASMLISKGCMLHAIETSTLNTRQRARAQTLCQKLYPG